MFTPLIRFTLLIICTIVSIIAALAGQMPIVIIAALLSLTLLWGYYNVGTIYLALHKTRKGLYNDAERIVELTRKPEKLSKSKKAYYYFIKGFVAREKDEFSTAINLLNLALDEGIKQEEDRALSLLALSDMAMVQGNKKEARIYLERMRGLKMQPNIIPQVKKMQSYLGV